MKSLETILREEQEIFLKYAMSKLPSYIISEMPTAFGKTITTLTLAIRLLKENKDKKVILVTSNNLLAKEILNESLQYEETKGLCSLVIGKDNYLDINKIKNFSEFYDYDKALTFCEDKIKEDGYILIDDFLDYIKVDDENINSYLKSKLKKEDSRDINMGDNKISITNYAYLLTLFLYAKKDKNEDGQIVQKLLINPDDYFFIFDEVQDLMQSAEVILSSSFSPYKLYLYTKSLMKDFENESFTGAKSLIKELKEYEAKLKLFYKILSDENKIGEYVINNKDFINKKVEGIKKVLISNELITSIKKRLNKYLKDNNSFSAKLFLKELEEGFFITNSSDVILHYSKSKGYINFYTYSKNIKFAMALNFWSKIDSFIGVTATAKLNEIEFGNEALYSYARLGINLNDIKDKNRKILAPAKASKCARVQKFKGVLSPTQAKYYITDDDYIEDSDLRANWIAKRVLANYDNKNSIVLAGGYDEVDKIYDILEKETDNKVSLIKAQRLKSASATLDEFKEKGGIAVLTRNFSTGVNLKGKLLEKLFITKLPYPVFTSKKWLELKEKNSKNYWYEYTNEMIINFRQAIGRLIRDVEDRGDIYILDTKLKNRPGNIEKRIKFFLETVSEKSDEMMK